MARSGSFSGHSSTNWPSRKAAPSSKAICDHVHMLIKIPPKHAVSSIIGYIKGKSAIAVARPFSGRKRNFSGESFWARGYAVSTVGMEEAQVRKYIREQEELEGRREQGLF